MVCRIHDLVLQFVLFLFCLFPLFLSFLSPPFPFIFFSSFTFPFPFLQLFLCARSATFYVLNIFLVIINGLNLHGIVAISYVLLGLGHVNIMRALL